MCFSAQASFAVGAALLPAGVYCTAIAARRRPAYLPLAIVPAVFSFQQVCEGCVWVGLARGDAGLVNVSALGFLAFALGFWPFWVPFSLLFVEGRTKVRWWLVPGALFGLALGSALYVPLALHADRWLEVRVLHHSIVYNPRGLPAFAVAPHEWWDAAYGMAVLVPFFLTSADRRLAGFRLLLAVSVAVSLVAFRDAFVSVWCFFAAVLSCKLCYIFYNLDDS